MYYHTTHFTTIKIGDYLSGEEVAKTYKQLYLEFKSFRCKNKTLEQNVRDFILLKYSKKYVEVNDYNHIDFDRLSKNLHEALIEYIREDYCSNALSRFDSTYLFNSKDEMSKFAKKYKLKKKYELTVELNCGTVVEKFDMDLIKKIAERVTEVYILYKEAKSNLDGLCVELCEEIVDLTKKYFNQVGLIVEEEIRVPNKTAKVISMEKIIIEENFFIKKLSGSNIH